MFEDINIHRQAVQEQIQKGFEIGFTGNELEKAHKVGDIHPNGKWVWTQLPSGRYDWRVIKKTGVGSDAAASATAQKKEISISANHPSLASVPGVQNIKDALTTYNSKYTDLSKVELIKTPKGNWDLHYDGHRLGIIAGSSISDRNAAKMGWIRNGSDDLTRSKREAEEEKKDSVNNGNPFDAYEDKNDKASKSKKSDVKYADMKRTAADKVLVGKKITVDGKEGRIFEISQWGKDGNVFAKIVFDDDFVNKEMILDIKDIDEGKTKLRGTRNPIGEAGKEVSIELSEEEPKRDTVTKESLKEFLDYITKNISKKNSTEFLNTARKFLSTVPRKYKGSSGNYYNIAATAARRLMNEFGM